MIRHIAVYATNGWADKELLTEAVRRMETENGWDMDDICLHVAHSNTKLRRMATSMSLSQVRLFSASHSAANADSLRMKLTKKGNHGSIVIWNGRSAGTKKFLDMAEAKGKPLAMYLV